MEPLPWTTIHSSPEAPTRPADMIPQQGWGSSGVSTRPARRRGRFSARGGQANDAEYNPLRTSVRRAIIGLSRIFHPPGSPRNPASGHPFMTTVGDLQIVPREPVSLPELRATDRGVASSLESVLSDNTRRVYATQWRIFEGWCDEVRLTALPVEPLTVARYLAARAGSGASVATLPLATSAISKAHE